MRQRSRSSGDPERHLAAQRPTTGRLPRQSSETYALGHASGSSSLEASHCCASTHLLGCWNGRCLVLRAMLRTRAFAHHLPSVAAHARFGAAALHHQVGERDPLAARVRHSAPLAPGADAGCATPDVASEYSRRAGRREKAPYRIDDRLASSVRGPRSQQFTSCSA